MRFDKLHLLNFVAGGLIVSCQSQKGEPAHGLLDMLGMAICAAAGGAKGLRLEGKRDISRISKKITLPVIGLIKKKIPGFEPYITPTIREALEVEKAGADMVAVDATIRPRPGFKTGAEFICELKRKLSIPVLADISTFDEGCQAAEAGADVIATTLSGYTPYSRRKGEEQNGPDFTLLRRLVKKLSIPVFLEGHVFEPRQAKRAIELGAHAVVVGSAITRPHLITRRFVSAIECE